MISPTHVVLLGILLLLALVVFGPKRLPELGHSVGRAIQEFKHASVSAREEFSSTTAELQSAAHPASADAPGTATPTVTETIAVHETTVETRG